MPAQLVALNDGPSILLDKPILLLGRHPECDIQIDSRKISRRHCCIAQVNDYLVIRDLDSTNGIRINGIRVTEGKLRPGDELTIGNHRYRLTWEESQPLPVRSTARPEHRVPSPAPVQDDDELLESCDEPIPLPEPGKGASNPLPPKIPPPAGKVDDDSFVLPENLELLPNKDSFPNLPSAPPQG